MAEAETTALPEDKPEPSIREAMNEPELQVKKEENKEPKAPVVKRIFAVTTSPTIGKIAEALAKAQGEMTNGEKDKQGYGYKYLQLPSLIDIARKPLSENGLAVFQSHELIKGNTPSVVTHSLMMHSSGEWINSSIEILITIMTNLSEAQMEGVAATYGRRYALQAMCLIAAEDDNDASKRG